MCGQILFAKIYCTQSGTKKNKKQKQKTPHRNKERKQRLEIQPGVTNILKS